MNTDVNKLLKKLKTLSCLSKEQIVCLKDDDELKNALNVILNKEYVVQEEVKEKCINQRIFNVLVDIVSRYKENTVDVMLPVSVFNIIAVDGLIKNDDKLAKLMFDEVTTKQSTSKLISLYYEQIKGMIVTTYGRYITITKTEKNRLKTIHLLLKKYPRTLFLVSEISVSDIKVNACKILACINNNEFLKENLIKDVILKHKQGNMITTLVNEE